MYRAGFSAAPVTGPRTGHTANTPDGIASPYQPGVAGLSVAVPKTTNTSRKVPISSAKNACPVLPGVYASTPSPASTPGCPSTPQMASPPAIPPTNCATRYPGTSGHGIFFAAARASVTAGVVGGPQKWPVPQTIPVVNHMKADERKARRAQGEMTPGDLGGLQGRPGGTGAAGAGR